MRKHMTFPALSSLSCFLLELATRLLMWQCSLRCKLLIIGLAQRAEGYWRFMAMVFFFLANELCKEVLMKSVQNRCSPLFLLRGLASSVAFFLHHSFESVKHYLEHPAMLMYVWLVCNYCSEVTIATSSAWKQNAGIRSFVAFLYH